MDSGCTPSCAIPWSPDQPNRLVGAFQSVFAEGRWNRRVHTWSCESASGLIALFLLKRTIRPPAPEVCPSEHVFHALADEPRM